MDVQAVTVAGEGEVLVVPMLAGLTPGPGAAEALTGLGAWAQAHLEAGGFTGASGQVAAIPTGGRPGPSTLVVVGLGEEADHEGLRRAAALARGAVPRAGAFTTTLAQVPIDGAVGAVVEGFALADYRFDAHKSSPEERPRPALSLVEPSPGWEEEARSASIVAEAVGFARDLVNEPAAGKGPAALADRIAAAAAGAGMTVEVWDTGRLEAERMGGVLGVGAGSHRPPCLVVLAHRPPGATATLALVGKGIVFDSGGLSLKPADMMEAMKTDMAGAAAVAAASVAVARLGVAVNLHAYLPLAENLPGGGAQRPGDVLRTRNGKTIEVLNTDAEGRLILADALALAAESAPDLIVDLATLTGACRVGLGDKIAGLFGTRGAPERVSAAAAGAGERVWALPLPDDYRPLIDSDVADMKNSTGSRYGGAITAALLLAEFVGEVPWAHLDIAGPARADKAEHYITKGATGFGVRTLVELAVQSAAM
jgi:leucyl aminopeptidase